MGPTIRMKGMCHMTQTVRERLSAPVSERALETILGATLALWTFGEILFEHSTFAQALWCVANRPVQYVQALVVGCLVAVLASKRFRLGVRDVALMFPLLFFALLVWGKSRDPHTLVLALFAVCVQGIDLRRLARAYATGAMVALVAALALTGWVHSLDSSFSLRNVVFGRYVFGYPGALSCLLFSIVSAACLFVRVRKARVGLAVLCVAFAALSAAPLHAKRCGVLFLLLAALIVADVLRGEALARVARRDLTLWVVAVLPAVLFCLVGDMRTLYGAGFELGAYANMTMVWGLGFSAAAALLFARAVLSWRGRDVDPVMIGIICFFSFLLVFEQQPMNLEFNVTLLMLAQGFARIECLPEDMSEPGVGEVYDGSEKGR